MIAHPIVMKNMNDLMNQMKNLDEKIDEAMFHAVDSPKHQAFYNQIELDLYDKNQDIDATVVDDANNTNNNSSIEKFDTIEEGEEEYDEEEDKDEEYDEEDDEEEYDEEDDEEEYDEEYENEENDDEHYNDSDIEEIVEKILMKKNNQIMQMMN